MNKLSALYFPETSLEKQTLCQLLLFFEQLYYYNPAEAPPSGFEQFVENDLVVGYPPLPLGDDLPRFQRMLRDLKGGGAELYKSSLLSMTMDQFRLKDRDEAATWSLKSSMTTSADSKKELAQKEAVWRATLFLELSKLLAQEEREIAVGLSNIATRQSQMLEAVRGDEETLRKEALPTVKPLAPIPSPVSAEQLARAWGQLYLRDNAAAGKKQILATSRQDVAELIKDIYETLSRKEPIKLCSLPLPLMRELDDDDFLGKRKTLRHATAEQLQKIVSAFGQIGHSDVNSASGELIASLQKEVGEMAGLLSDAFASQSAGKSTLAIYLLEGISWPQIFMKLCQPGLDEISITSDTEARNGMLAVLNPCTDY